MSEQAYSWGVVALFAAAPVVFVSLFFLVAPYGRHGSPGWGPTVSARLGWIVMEAPSPLAFLWFFSRGDHGISGWPLLFASLYVLHYGQRTLVFPLLMRSGGKGMPLFTAGLSFAFNALNGSLNGWAVSQLGGGGAAMGSHPLVWIGLGLFAAGMAINLRSDAILRGLRKPGETGYSIPRGGLFRFVSCPNYLGEIVEWTGWALATGTAAGAAFALFTAANLVPRAVAHHRWYRERFADYPAQRRAWLPWVW
ncbi:MAG: DUF1295 domain-containing protein [Myxococcota bacterium]